MKVFGIDLSVLLISLITAYMGYQFNFRVKKREIFLKELNTSYSEVYFPMFELLSEINDTKDKTRKLQLIDAFFLEYSGINSKIRFIGSSFILDYFYSLRVTYMKYKNENSRTNERELFEKLSGLYIMIEEEYWNAHDIIYEDYKQFISDSFNNPFFVILFNILRLLYHLSVFLLWSSLLLLYFTIYYIIFPNEWVPQWWSISHALLLLASSAAVFALMLMVKEMAVKKNRRPSRVIKSLKEKIVGVFRR